jgi:hypothetical protein
MALLMVLQENKLLIGREEDLYNADANNRGAIKIAPRRQEQYLGSNHKTSHPPSILS